MFHCFSLFKTDDVVFKIDLTAIAGRIPGWAPFGKPFREEVFIPYFPNDGYRSDVYRIEGIAPERFSFWRLWEGSASHGPRRW
jgi:hypothetical protein